MLIDQQRNRLVRRQRSQDSADGATPIDNRIPGPAANLLEEIVQQRVVERSARTAIGWSSSAWTSALISQ